LSVGEEVDEKENE
jgi:hypothetical protein